MVAEPREMVITALNADGYVDEIVAGRIFQYNALDEDQRLATRPFLVIKMGLERPEPGWRRGPVDQAMQIWAHDDPGDYGRIDRVLRYARTAIENIQNTEGFFEARYVDTTGDLDDNALGTILRYSRYQWTFTN